MNTNVSFRHMDTSPSLRDYATGKLEKICDKYVHGKVDANVTMSVEKYWHIANFTLSIKNLTIRVEERSEDMYSSIDLALDKIEKQLRRHKDRIRDHKPSNGAAKTFKMGVLAPLDGSPPLVDEDEDFAEDYERYPAPDPEEVAAQKEDENKQVIQTDKGEVTVLRQAEYEAKTLSLDEAVLQLEMLEDREFFVFTNSDSGSINVVFKRHDGNVGLIET